jgi:hypothetical protein
MSVDALVGYVLNRVVERFAALTDSGDLGGELQRAGFADFCSGRENAHGKLLAEQHPHAAQYPQGWSAAEQVFTDVEAEIRCRGQDTTHALPPPPIDAAISADEIAPRQVK